EPVRTIRHAPPGPAGASRRAGRVGRGARLLAHRPGARRPLDPARCDRCGGRPGAVARDPPSWPRRFRLPSRGGPQHRRPALRRPPPPRRARRGALRDPSCRRGVRHAGRGRTRRSRRRDHRHPGRTSPLVRRRGRRRGRAGLTRTRRLGGAGTGPHTVPIESDVYPVNRTGFLRAATVAALAVGTLAGCDRLRPPDLTLPTDAEAAAFYSSHGSIEQVAVNGTIVEVRVRQPESQLRRGGTLWAKVGPSVYLFSPDTEALFQSYNGVAAVRVTTYTGKEKEVARV